MDIWNQFAAFALLFSFSNLIQVMSFHACILINTEVCRDGIKLHVFKP